MAKLKIVVIVAAGVLASYFVSSFALTLGDRLVKEDHVRRADLAYLTARITNPFNPVILKRMAITGALLDYWRGDDFQVGSSISAQGIFSDQTTTTRILLYHNIRINPNAKDVYGNELSVAPNNLRDQIEYLSAHNYRIISMDEFEELQSRDATASAKNIILTFDDGYQDFYTAAYPLLKSRHMKAVLFIISDFVGQPNYLTWSEIDEMKQSGLCSIESHTVDHIMLTSLSDKQIKKELADSKAVLEKHLAAPVNWLAYPYGHYDERIKKIVAETGYHGAVDGSKGDQRFPENRYNVPRIAIRGGESLQDFAAVLQ